jgi:hypothetical protein
MSAITHACNHTSVTKLMHSFGDLPKDLKDNLALLAGALDSREDHKKYKFEIINYKKKQQPSIPELSAYL